VKIDLWRALAAGLVGGGVSFAGLLILNAVFKVPLTMPKGKGPRAKKQAATVQTAVVATSAVGILLGFVVDKPVAFWLQDVVDPPKTPIEREVNALMWRALKDPTFAERAGYQKPVHTRALVRELARDGLARADATVLQKRMRVMRELVQSGDDDFAIAAYRYNASPDPLDERLAKATRPQRRAWFDVQLALVRAGLAAEAQPYATSAQTDAALRALADLVGEPEGARLLKMTTIDHPSHDTAAWVARTIFEYLPALPEPHQSVLLRAMLQERVRFRGGGLGLSP
jgi:hypothetical protein